jgi:hypothetical protein
MRHYCTSIALACTVIGSVPSRSNAQVSGYVVTLGADTVQVERVSRAGNKIDGVIALRSPATILVNYSATLTGDGRIATFEQWVLNGDGTPLNPDNGKSMMAVVGDSIQRESGPRDYNPSRDFARIPMTRSAAATTVERLTIGIRDGALVVEWDDAVYSVPVRVR